PDPPCSGSGAAPPAPDPPTSGRSCRSSCLSGSQNHPYSIPLLFLCALSAGLGGGLRRLLGLLPLPQQGYIPAAGHAGGIAHQGKMDGGVRQLILSGAVLHLSGHGVERLVQTGAEGGVSVRDGP